MSALGIHPHEAGDIAGRAPLTAGGKSHSDRKAGLSRQLFVGETQRISLIRLRFAASIWREIPRFPAAKHFCHGLLRPAPPARSVRLAFTLVEMLVVIGIIGVLLAILLPSLGAVRKTSRNTKTMSVYQAISVGLETYRNDTSSPYPPSRSDNPNNALEAVSPYQDNTRDIKITVTGANLLVWGLVGADLLGTPGFIDADRQNDGWWNDTHAMIGFGGTLSNGLYALEQQTRQPLNRRFNTYLDVNKVNIVTMKDFAEDTLKPRGQYPQGAIGNPELYDKQLLLLDGFGFPILYYRANVGAASMVSTASTTGVYDQRDNGLYTGSQFGSGGFGAQSFPGINMGAGNDHQIKVLIDVHPAPQAAGGDLNNQTFDRSFARFIWDRQVTVRNEPVNKDSYILLSPGADAIWGTDDDVKNF